MIAIGDEVARLQTAVGELSKAVEATRNRELCYQMKDLKKKCVEMTRELKRARRDLVELGRMRRGLR